MWAYPEGRDFLSRWPGFPLAVTEISSRYINMTCNEPEGCWNDILNLHPNQCSMFYQQQVIRNRFFMKIRAIIMILSQVKYILFPNLFDFILTLLNLIWLIRSQLQNYFLIKLSFEIYFP